MEITNITGSRKVHGHGWMMKQTPSRLLWALFGLQTGHQRHKFQAMFYRLAYYAVLSFIMLNHVDILFIALH